MIKYKKVSIVVALVVVSLLVGCAKPEEKATPTPTPMMTLTPTPEKTPTPTPTPSKVEKIKAIFMTSLHYTREGKETFYSAENGGFEKLTGIPIEELGCKKCHAKTKADGTPIKTEEYKPDCYDCHKTPGDEVEDKVCLGCHGRQGVELKLEKKMPELFSDVHREAGLGCTDCHTADDVHGVGEEGKSSLLESTIKAKCENCHEAEKNTAHLLHKEKVDCKACHVKTVISCYNCHLDSLVEAHVKRPYAPLSGFKILMNFNGKVTSATLMVLKYEDKTFYVVAPFFSHTVTKDVSCSDCHDNEALKEYEESGKIVFTKWNESSGKLEWKKGVIPLVPDWRNAFVLDFLDYKADPHNPVKPFDQNWTYMKTGADLTQILYGEPLTEEQLEKLAKKI